MAQELEQKELQMENPFSSLQFSLPPEQNGFFRRTDPDLHSRDAPERYSWKAPDLYFRETPEQAAGFGRKKPLVQRRFSRGEIPGSAVPSPSAHVHGTGKSAPLKENAPVSEGPVLRIFGIHPPDNGWRKRVQKAGFPEAARESPEESRSEF